MNLGKLGHDIAALAKDAVRYPAAVGEYRFIATNGVLNSRVTGRGVSEDELRRRWFEDQRDRERQGIKDDLHALKVDIVG